MYQGRPGAHNCPPRVGSTDPEQAYRLYNKTPTIKEIFQPHHHHRKERRDLAQAPLKDMLFNIQLAQADVKHF